MSAQWVEANNRYLAASLLWLRLTLQQAIAQAAASAAAAAPVAAPASASTVSTVSNMSPVTSPAARWPAPPAAAQAPWRGWLRRDDATAFVAGPAVPPPVAEPAVASPPLLPPPPPPAPSPPFTAEIEAAAAARAEAATAGPAPALTLLAQRFGLTPFEADVLLICAAVELDPAMPALYAQLQRARADGQPSFALALQLLDEPSWDALSPHRPLRYARLVQAATATTSGPLTVAALRADERIVHFIKGRNELDERLSALMLDAPEADAPLLSPSQQAVVDQLLSRLQSQAASGAAATPVLVLQGSDAASARETARAVCAALGRELYRLPLAALPTVRAEVDELARLWQRECLLLPVALYLDADEAQGAGAEASSAALRQWLSRPLGLVFVALREPLSAPIDGAWSVDVRAPSAAEQYLAWSTGLRDAMGSEAAARGASQLAGQFDLNLAEIRGLLHATPLEPAARQPGDAADASASGAADAVLQRLWAASLRTVQPRLDGLAQRIEPQATWDDLVLADEVAGLLHQIADQVRQRWRVHQEWDYAGSTSRGLGISVLFSGESGTGKTTAAEVIASELSLALYRIDLSAVVSKYIGETEKNLRRLFDAAERGGAILFFDEADALFGKRSEVKDSHDRYANIEINYLLQRMESFSGLAILATNMKAALDPAFVRRLRFIVNFPYPGPRERLRIWQRAWPPAVPREPLDLERLARFNLSGGNIHSVALNAAFVAAAQGGPVTQDTVLAAVRSELRKLEKPVNDADFRP